MIVKYKPAYECDLHCHTKMSDGNDTYEELILKAANLNMKAIGIVDHDITPKNPDFFKTIASDKGIELVFGYEFSCDSYVDDVHIIGYELDWQNRLLLEEEKRAAASKPLAYKKLCEILNSNGFQIDYEKEILEFIDENGQLLKRKPEEVQRKHIFELMAQKGYFESWEKAKLFVRDDPVFNVRREKINPLKAIEIIQESGGLAVLAHPYLIDEKINSMDIKASQRKDYIDILISAGLDGIESCYTYNKTSYKGSLTNRQIQDLVEADYKKRVKFFTGGSDYHNDEKKGAKNPRFIGEAGISYSHFKKIFI
ncbi:MAG: PHP domain-containing protein [Actinobacteria bacterium]|nr:PHP domain-containing protein [Actinomycetota bacterium]